MTDTVDERVAVRSTGRVVAAIVLAVIGILAIIAAVIYFTTDAHSLPSILGTIKYTGHNHSRAYTPRTLRAIVSLIVGVILLIAAGFSFFWKTKRAAD